MGELRGGVGGDIERLGELGEWTGDNKEIVEGKKMVSYWRGGVRCEKFWGWLKGEGFEDVCELEGGIVS